MKEVSIKNWSGTIWQGGGKESGCVEHDDDFVLVQCSLAAIHVLLPI